MENRIFRNTIAEINLDAIGYNIEQLQSRIGESKFIAVLKADGYGHGSVPIAKKAVESGVDFLAVALLEEAITLRENGIDKDIPILVLGRVSAKYAQVASEQNISLTIFQEEWFNELQEDQLTAPLHVHLKIDSGMGRSGVRTTEEIESVVNKLKDRQDVQLEGVYTHFATADEVKSPYYDLQVDRFEQLLNVLDALIDQKLIVHIGNSAAGIQYPEQMRHYTRFGISLYGMYPSDQIRQLDHVELKPALSLKSEIVHVKKVPKDEGISYGTTYKTEDEEWIATIPIGYGDGWNRRLQGFHVLVDGKLMPIVGRVCMDFTMVKLDQPYDVGTEVVLIGEQDGEVIEADDLANHLDTINYEITCQLTKRIPRIYTGN